MSDATTDRVDASPAAPGARRRTPIPPANPPPTLHPTESEPEVRVRPGDLVQMWRWLLGLAWLGAFFSYAAVWQVSVQIGIGAWWVGPRAQPTNVLVKVLPFVVALSIVLCVVYRTPRIVRTSALGAALAIVFAIPDFSRSTGLALLELTIAGLLAIVTLCALTGRYTVAGDTEGSLAGAEESGAAVPSGPGSTSWATPGSPPTEGSPSTEGLPPAGESAHSSEGLPPAGESAHSSEGSLSSDDSSRRAEGSPLTEGLPPPPRRVD